MEQAAFLLALASHHEKSKWPFYGAAIALVVWAAFVSFNGFTRGAFPTSGRGVRVLVGISAVLVAAAISTGIITGTSPAPAKPFTKPGLGGLTKGQVPPPTSGAAAAATSGGAPAATPAPAAASGAALLAADPGGQLAFTTKTLTVTPKHGKVTIQFTNSSPIQHNLTVSSTAKLFGATPTFQGGTKTLTLTIPPGTYQFYCSVPGHRQAGMQGTLVVR